MQLRFAFFFIGFTTLFLACSSDPGPNLVDSQAQLSDDVARGGWKITYYSDSDKDETNHFNGYTFVFETNKIITATKGTAVIKGSWSITDSHSNDDNPDHLHFNITFSSPDSFEDLTEDWQFISQTDRKIELIHISGGNGGTDYLTFERM